MVADVEGSAIPGDGDGAGEFLEDAVEGNDHDGS